MIYYDRNGVIVRQARAEDIDALKNRLRRADAEEVLAAGCTSQEHALAQSYERSTIRLTVELQGNPVAMFGVIPEGILGTTGNVWFLGAEEMGRIKKTFVRLSRHFIAYFLSQYPCIWNVVDSRYSSSIQWLKSCRAQFNEKPIVLNGIPFYGFKIVREA